MVNGFIGATYRENGRKCRYTKAKEAVYSFNQAVFLLQKDSPYTASINEQLNNFFVFHIYY